MSLAHPPLPTASVTTADATLRVGSRCGAPVDIRAAESACPAGPDGITVWYQRYHMIPKVLQSDTFRPCR
jgi:hypothetical protein